MHLLIPSGDCHIFSVGAEGDAARPRLSLGQVVQVRVHLELEADRALRWAAVLLRAPVLQNAISVAKRVLKPPEK